MKEEKYEIPSGIRVPGNGKMKETTGSENRK
jgi:hypothetical protein